jgi:hypothetical protein
MDPAKNPLQYMEALKDITGGAPGGIFSTMFCQVLFAQQAAINTLFAQVIELSGNGVIRGNYSEEDETGFIIRASDGSAEFNNILIRGNSMFAGDIVSGPLELNNRNSSSPTEIKQYTKGSFTDDFFNYISGKGQLSEVIPTNGTYGNISFSYFRIYQYIKQTYACVLYDKDMINLKEWEVKSPVYSPPSQWAPKFDYGDFQIGFYNPNGKTFKLNNLPINEPNLVGAIWQDSSGYLRIKK